ncbi:MAG: hypothetical protein K8U57_27920 [Planctomycetes bacterium]|nr:hypothetical protein [Planctomycetota bacterium]
MRSAFVIISGKSLLHAAKLAACSLCLTASTVLAATPASQPAMPPAVAAEIEGLGSPSKDESDAAVLALIQLGRPMASPA